MSKQPLPNPSLKENAFRTYYIMKNITFALLLLMAVIITAGCSSQNTKVASPTLVGKWQLTETLSDPGDGSGKWMPAEKDSKQLVEFGKDGSVSGNAMPETSHYTITDSIHLALTQQGNTAPITYRYKVAQNTLTLNPPCREACGMRYIRVK